MTMQTPDQYFDSKTWWEKFSPEIVVEARKYFHQWRANGTHSVPESAIAAWHYANGLQAAKMMAERTPTVE